MLRPPLVLGVALAACASTSTVTSPSPELEGCSRRVSDLRAQGADDEEELRYLHARELWEKGQPQPATEAALAQDLNRYLADSRAAGRPHKLECRTWVCQLDYTAVFPPGQGVMGTINQSLGQRVEDMPGGVTAQQKAPDGTATTSWRVWLVLRHPMGEPRTREQLEQEARGTPPADLAACRAEESRLTGEADRRRGELVKLRRPTEEDEFRTLPPNPALTDEVGKLIVEGLRLPPRPPAEVVSCRGRLCKVLVPMTDERIPMLRGRVFDGFHPTWVQARHKATPTAFLYALDPRRRNTRHFVNTWMGRVRGELRRCDGKAPGKGLLTLQFDLPATEGPPAPPKVNLRYTGNLVGTPLGRCVTDVIAEQLGKAEPGQFAALSNPVDFLFPR
jgi:hypothetical protein